MPLSDRVQRLRPAATLGVMSRVQAMRDRGIDVVAFGAGQPDFDTPEDVREAAIDALRAGMTRYTVTAGPLEAREAIAEKLRRDNRIECDASHVVITNGAKQALYMTLQAVVDPGREVILPTPAWVSYRPMIELAGGVAVEVHGPIENRFKILPEQLERALSDRTAAIVFNSPSNPCGTMYTPEELDAFADILARRPDVTILSDEIYEKIAYGEVPHVSIGSRPQVAEQVVTVNGLSKAYAMTGWRIGYLCAPGRDGEIAAAATKLQEQMTSNITSFTYPSVVRALRHGGDIVERMRREFAARAEIIHRRLEAMPGLPCPTPDGAFYVFPDVSAHLGSVTPGGRTIDSGLAFAEALLEEARVAVVPGADFGRGAENHVRLSFACSRETIERGCDRLEAWLGSLAPAPAVAAARP